MRRTRCGLMILACLALFFCGCGGGGIPRTAVSGSVSLDGQPLQDGNILFIPMEEGPSAGGAIEGGRYQLDGEQGPSPGRYRVEIRAYRDTGRTERDELTGEAERLMTPIIPPRYNRESELEIELAPGVQNEFDFALHSE